MASKTFTHTSSALPVLVGLCAAGFIAGPAARAATIPGVSLAPKIWYEADEGVTTDGSGNVTSWTDKSGNGNTLTQATLGRQPSLIQDATPSGAPTIRFDGVDDHLLFTNGIRPNNMTLFVVTRPSADDDDNDVIVGGPSGSMEYLIHNNGKQQVNEATTFAFGSSDLIVPVGQVNIMVAVVGDEQAGGNNWGYFFRLNQAADGGGTEFDNRADFDADSVSVGASVRSNGDVDTPFEGDIAALIYFNDTLSDADIQDVENYLYQQFAVPEPGSLALLGLGGLALLRRKRRRA